MTTDERKPVQLESLQINLVKWGENKGLYETTINYEGKSGNVKLLLDTRISNALLAVIGPIITKFAAEQAKQLENDINFSVESATQPLLEAK